MRAAIIVCAVLLLTACANAFISKNRANLTRLNLGMTKDEVHSVMGREGYRYQGNPYRSAMYLAADGKPVEAFYYWTDHTANGVPDKDLTPVVFNDGKVVGWGREFWTEYVSKYEVRIKNN